MTILKKTFSFLISTSFFIVVLFLSACEDDAILTPQGIEEEECTGSYCSLNLPGSSSKNNHDNPKVF
tara:strand:+ start:1275 stop:1475 length:201 start_codon:yes stop_codon:yes gene_type:complete